MATKGHRLLKRLAQHKPAQAQQLHHEGDQVELVGHHAAEDWGDLSFQALQDQFDQPDDHPAGKPPQSCHAAVTPRKQAEAAVNTVTETIFVKKKVP